MKPIVEVQCHISRKVPGSWFGKDRYLSRERAQQMIAAGWRVQPVDRVPGYRQCALLGIFTVGAVYTPVRFRDQLPPIVSKWP